MKLKKLENQLKAGFVPDNIKEVFDFTKTEIYSTKIAKEVKEYNSNLSKRINKKNLTKEVIDNKKDQFLKKLQYRLSKDVKFLLSAIRNDVIEEFLHSTLQPKDYWLDQVDEARWYFGKRHDIEGGGYSQKGILVIKKDGETYNITENNKNYKFLVFVAMKQPHEGWINQDFETYKGLRRFFEEKSFESFDIVNCDNDLYINLKKKKLEKERLY